MAAQDPTVSTESNASALVVTAYVMLALTWISVILRTYVRGFLTKGFLADDWWMLAAQANFTVSCAFILRGCFYGLGRHNKSLSVYDEVNSIKWQALATATYVLNMWLIKMSIGIFLLRIATLKRYRYTLYISISIVGVWSLVLFFWNIFQCNPVEAQWDYTILSSNPNARCVSVDQVVSAAYALSVMTILSDWLFALLPIPMVWNVKMSVQAKMTVMAILGVGIFASVATLVRLKYLADLTEVDDILYAGTNAMVWTLIEPALAIIASSLATIRPLLRAWNIRGFQSTERSRSTGFRYGKQPSRNAGPNGMPGFGSADVTLADIETGHGKSDASRTAKNNNGGNDDEISASTGSWGSSNKGPHVMSIVQEAEEREDGQRTAAIATTEPAGHKKTPASGIQRVTTITQTTMTTATTGGGGTAAATNGLSSYGTDPSQQRTGSSFQGQTFLASDQGSISSIELANMQPQNADDVSPLPHGASTRRR
ncbi:hypothetical protein Micbo1qcDRAFT_232643 [Microdochium bolleyi]|uniref:Rhodopsin domain-containing protein n=1 Tax=Microdochium bolleyi TaxID=196109 RepID=A0A136J762_9PEZI|nr:hypothetical protein Micbo1qcDRAFT_232643 [Microdochium bolleyi]